MRSLACFILIGTVVTACGRVEGPRGESGATGLIGQHGYSTLVELVSNPVACANGGVSILTGLDLDRDGKLTSSEIEYSQNVCNGNAGARGERGNDGAQGPQGQQAVLEIIDPCGDAANIYDEVLLRLGDGTLLASFSDNSNGKNTRFSVLPPGSYVTTDGSNCMFSVDNDLQVIY